MPLCPYLGRLQAVVSCPADTMPFNKPCGRGPSKAGWPDSHHGPMVLTSLRLYLGRTAGRGQRAQYIPIRPMPLNQPSGRGPSKATMCPWISSPYTCIWDGLQAVVSCPVHTSPPDAFQPALWQRAVHTMMARQPPRGHGFHVLPPPPRWSGGKAADLSSIPVFLMERFPVE